jgi:hypothetical protein
VQNNGVMLAIAIEHRTAFHFVKRKVVLMRVLAVDGVKSQADDLSCNQEDDEVLRIRVAVVRNEGERLKSHIRSYRGSYEERGQA